VTETAFLGGAGIWDVDPRVHPRPFPYLRLLWDLRDLDDPTSVNTHRLEPALAQKRADLLMGQDETSLLGAGEQLVTLVARRRRSPLLARRVERVLAVSLPIRTGLPAIDSRLAGVVTAAAAANGILWDAASLQKVREDDKFVYLESPAPVGAINLELDGATYNVEASEFVAAGLRLAVAETLRIAESKQGGLGHLEL
jgi:hypothetical protein